MVRLTETAVIRVPGGLVPGVGAVEVRFERVVANL
jgi:hypothetical protein